MLLSFRDKLKQIDPELKFRIKASNLSLEDQKFILFILRILPNCLKLIEKGKTSIKKLQKIIWGRTESSRNVLADIEKEKNKLTEADHKAMPVIVPVQDGIPAQPESNSNSIVDLPNGPDVLPIGNNPVSEQSSIATNNSPKDTEQDNSDSRPKANVIPIGKKKNKSDQQKKPRKSSVRGVDAYPDAERITVAHTEYKSGDPCPKCLTGKLYMMAVFGKIIKFLGAPFLYVKIYLQEKLRCNTCGWIVAAQLPKEALGSKANSAAQAMIALLKYGAGLPFYRMATIQKYLKMPTSASSLWLMLTDLIEIVMVIWPRLRHHAAQGELLHNDDTTNKILELMKASKDPNKKPKKTVYTSGILSVLKGGIKIILFFTGEDHAGKNLENLLTEREASLTKPIHMSDASSMNDVKIDTNKGSCLTHIRRYFVECYSKYKADATHFITAVGKVYAIDAETKNLSKEDRLLVHQEKSRPIMDELHKWMTERLTQNLVEPNSALGEAMAHALKHWVKATLFLRVAGVPLSNDELEQKFKMVKLSVKNAMFYRTLWGALVGDVFMSIIHTTVLANENPYEYLVTILDNKTEVLKNPDCWMPWNFRMQIEKRSLAA